MQGLGRQGFSSEENEAWLTGDIGSSAYF